MQSSIDAIKLDTDDKIKKRDYYFTDIKTIIKEIMVQNQRYSPDKVDSSKAQYSDTVFPDNKKAPPL